MYAYLIKLVSYGAQIFYVPIIAMLALLVSKRGEFKNSHYKYGFNFYN